MFGIWTALWAGSMIGAGPTPSVPVGQLWLGVSPPLESCPPPAPGWSLSPARPAPLDRFCAYVRNMTQPLEEPGHSTCSEPATCGQVDGLGSADTGRVRPQQQLDAPVLDEDGWDSGLSAAMVRQLKASFASHADVPLSSLGGRIGASDRARLALVDTLSAITQTPAATHGPTLRALALDLAMRSQGPGAIELAPHLALPRLPGGRTDYVNGGYYGTLWDLAQAIVAAVDEARTAQQPHLVINLSLGWDPHGLVALPANHLDLINQGGGSMVPAPMRAVHAALVYARCAGALIYAASGNDDLGLRDRTGPLLPAGWAAFGAPTSAQCQTYWGGTASVGARPNTPLVYAVGGLGNDDGILPSARPDSTPGLVAPSESVPPPRPGRILTGTSVGTMVASTTATLVWGLLPRSSADDVHDLLTQTARPLGWAAEVCSGVAPCPAARAVAMCAAQRQACLRSRSCQNPTCLPHPPYAWPDTMFAFGGLAAMGRPPRLSRVFYTSEAKISSCGSVKLPHNHGWLKPALPCPTDEVVAFRALEASPQPVDPVCPACFVLTDPTMITVALDIVSSVPGATLHSPVLVVSDGGQLDIKFALPHALPQSFSTVFQLVPGAPFPVNQAWLQYELHTPGGRFSVAEPLIVD